jgi:hypothetical protein
MAVAFLRVVLYLGLLLLVMSVFALIIVPRDAPGFVAAVLAVGFNVLTVSFAAGLLRWWLAREARQEQQQTAVHREAAARGELPTVGEDEDLPRRP